MTTQTRFTIEIVMDDEATKTPEDISEILADLTQALRGGLEWDVERKTVYLFDRNHQRVGMAWLSKYQMGPA